jgi:hypothetical protein
VYSPLTLIVAGFLVFPMLVFVAARLFLPSEGVRIDLNPPADSRGLFISAIRANQGLLQTDDVLLEIEGQPIESILEDVFTLDAAFRLDEGSALAFTILRNGQSTQVEMPIARYPLIEDIRENWPLYLYPLYLFLISAFVYLRRQNLPAARLLFLFGAAALSTSTVFNMQMQPSDLIRGWLLILWLFVTVILYGVFSALIIHFSLVFPRPQTSLIQNHWSVLLIYFSVWIPSLAYLLFTWPSASTRAAQLLLVIRAMSLMQVVFILATLFFIIQGYRKYFNERERRQVRWVVWGMAIALVPFLIANVLPTLFNIEEVIPIRWIGLLVLVIPTGFAIAILRENLFDIDVLINKSLVYGSLTLLLALFYFGLVLVLQQLVPGGSQIVIVASTLITAAMFAPLRNRLQSIIDRRFYRRKYDAERTLARFSEALRQEVEFERMSSGLLDVVAENVQPENVSLWIAPPSVKSVDHKIRE